MVRLVSLASVLVLAALACNSPTTIDEHPCPPGGTTLTYENFGEKFIDDNCQSCHASRSRERLGAPADHFFDNREDIVRQRDRIFVRSAADNDSMPPGPNDPPEDERQKLADWLACGAP